MNDSTKQATKAEEYTIMGIALAIVAFCAWYTANGAIKGDKYIFLKGAAIEITLLGATLGIGSYIVRKRIKKTKQE